MCFFGGRKPLISAVHARKAPSSLTGTALRAVIRSLLTREGSPFPHPLPGARYSDTGAGMCTGYGLMPLCRPVSGPKRPRQDPRPPQIPGSLSWHTPSSHPQFIGTASQEPARRETAHHSHKTLHSNGLPQKQKSPAGGPARRTIFSMSQGPSGILIKGFGKVGDRGEGEPFPRKGFPPPANILPHPNVR